MQSQNHLFTLCQSHLSHGFVPHSLAQEGRSFLIFYFRLRNENHMARARCDTFSVLCGFPSSQARQNVVEEGLGCVGSLRIPQTTPCVSESCSRVWLELARAFFGRSQRLEMLASCSMEAPTLESVCCVEHPPCMFKRRSTTTAQARNWIQNNTRRKPPHVVSNHQALRLTYRRCAVRTNLVAQSASRFHSQESNSLAMHHGDVPFGKVVVPRLLWDKKTRERNKEPDLIEANVSWAPWAYGCLEGRRREGAILVQQKCQLSAAEAGVTSILRLHDATNGNLAMKHNAAKQGVNEMVLKGADKFFFDERISLAVMLRRATSTFWRDKAYGLRIYCASRIFVKAT